MFRNLRADEIECRVQSCRTYGSKVIASVLLYKDARCDMNILDETVGQMNWERSHSIIDGNLYCAVSIWDAEKNQWITKQDVGTESMTEKEKGQASDSFKRACFNWGIGRELYTAPRIDIELNDKEYSKTDKIRAYIALKISEIEIIEKKIKRLVLVDKKGNKRFIWNADNPLDFDKRPEYMAEIGCLIHSKIYSKEEVTQKSVEMFGKTSASELTDDELSSLLKELRINANYKQ